VREVLRLGFETMDLSDLWANVLPDNKASRNLLEKLGFEERGTRPYAFRSVEKTTIYYALPRWQWQAQQTNGSKAS
jgi:RimJ/RimL family protein N-acetyltransferase